MQIRLAPAVLGGDMQGRRRVLFRNRRAVCTAQKTMGEGNSPSPELRKRKMPLRQLSEVLWIEDEFHASTYPDPASTHKHW